MAGCGGRAGRLILLGGILGAAAVGCRRDEAPRPEPASASAGPGAMARPVAEEPPRPPAPSASAPAPTPAEWGPCKSAGKVSVTRYNMAMTRLPDGRVLLIGGGIHDSGGAQVAVDVVDPDRLTVEPFAPLNLGRLMARAVALPGGTVVVAHGITTSKEGSPSVEIYSPESKSWRLIRGLARFEVIQPLVAALPGGKVLVAGGDLSWKGALSQESCLLDVATGKATPTGPLPGPGATGGFYRYDKRGAVVWAAENRDENGVPDGKDCDLSFDPEKKVWTDTGACRSVADAADRYPDASGKTSLFGHGTSTLMRYENRGWKEVHAFPKNTPGSSLYDGLGIDAHRLVGVDGETGDVLVCSL